MPRWSVLLFVVVFSAIAALVVANREREDDRAPAAAPPPRASLEGNSDHAPFEQAGIPVGGIFTGLGDCYHQRCDTLRNVDRDVLALSARAAERTLVDLASP